MSTKEVQQKLVRDRSDSTSEDSSKVEPTIKRRRSGPRQFNSAGPLGFLEGISIPGYHLHLANTNGAGGKNPYRVQQLINDNVGYDFVHKDELPQLQQSELVDISDTKIKIRVGAGANDYAYLLKIPDEYYQEDLKAKAERNSAKVSASSDGKVESNDIMTSSSLKLS